MQETTKLMKENSTGKTQMETYTPEDDPVGRNM
jgi:hypothetical protein